MSFIFLYFFFFFFFFFVYFFFFFFFFFNDTATTEIYTLSLHDALPSLRAASCCSVDVVNGGAGLRRRCLRSIASRSEEHTSELQSRRDLVCRLLLEKKKKNKKKIVAQIKNKKRK